MTRRPAAALAALTLAALVLGGCSGGGAAEPDAGPDAAPPPSATPEAPDVTVGPAVWATRSADLDQPQLEDVGDEVLLVTAPGPELGTVLEVVDAGTGRTRWRLEPPAFGATSATSYVPLGATVGEGADGRELVTVPYERYRCPEPVGGVVDVDDCERSAGVETRDALTGEVRWRWRSRAESTDGFVLGAPVTPEAVRVPLRGGILGLDPATGERLWWADVPQPGPVGDGVGLVAPRDPGGTTHRVLDLATGRVLRSVESDRSPVLAGSVLAWWTGDEVRLEDAQTGELLDTVDGADGLPPTGPRSVDGLAWFVDDQLVTLVPGEDELAASPLPEAVAAEDLATGIFAGDVAGGVLVVSTDDGVLLVGRDGGVGEPSGRPVVSVQSVTAGNVVVQVATRRDGPEPPIAVRPIR